MPKFLIIRFSSIGDIVLTTPVVRCLKQQVPNAEVHYLTKSGFFPILQNNPYIDRLITYKKKLSEVLPALKKEQYDFVIDLHHNLRSLKVKWALGTKSFSFPKLNIEKWMATALKINKLPQVHIVDRYLETLKTFHVNNDGRGLDYFIDDNEKIAWQKLPNEFHTGYIGLVIGAALPTKKMPREKLRAICEGLSHPIVLLGGPDDTENGDFIAKNLTHVFNACGKFFLNESAGLVQKASAIITHDTGLMHIAAAFQKPVISIWGNTIPQFGMAPYFGSHTPAPLNHLFEVPNLSCRPCSKIGHQKCPKGHFDCMQKQDIDQIITSCKWLLPFNQR
jgi:heptosyltransferase-2